MRAQFSPNDYSSHFSGFQWLVAMLPTLIQPLIMLPIDCQPMLANVVEAIIDSSVVAITIAFKPPLIHLASITLLGFTFDHFNCAIKVAAEFLEGFATITQLVFNARFVLD